ncbi:TPA: HflC protein, partial [Candidatus Gracilibacteria bacterium]|nr:HflC protein [Candidatus Gracilibacteria bacterium]
MFTSFLNFFKKTTFLTIIVIVGLIIANSSFGTIGAGQRGILLRFGAVTGTVYNEGLYFKIPFIEDVKKIDVKVQKEQTEATSASKDLQAVHAVVALNFHILPKEVGKIYQEIGIDYKDKLIDPAIQESVKASTAKFTAEELISKREIVRAEMKKLLTEKLFIWGINVDDVNIVNFNFSESFNTA